MGRQAISRAKHSHIRPRAERVSRATSLPTFADNRPQTVALRKQAEALHDSPRLTAQRKLAEAMNNSSRMAAQRKLIGVMNAGPVQRQNGQEEEKLLQMRPPMQLKDGVPDRQTQLHSLSEPLRHNGLASDNVSHLATKAETNSSVAHPTQDRAVQLMHTNPPRNAPRTTVSLLRERMSAGFDVTSVLGGIATTGAAALLGLNPLGWGLAAGLAGTAALSYLRGPGNAQRDRDRRMGLENYTEVTDPDWTPTDVARRHIARAQSGETNYPLETTSHDWEGESQRLDTSAGMMTFHKGRGGQPYIRTRAPDFGGAVVSDDYDSLVRALSSDNPEVEEERANQVLMMARGETVDVSGESGIIRRAMTYLLGMTQVAEENPSRSSGSAGMARACLTRIADGTSTFFAEFNRTNGNYIPARIGGTGMMREVVSGTRALDEDVAGNMSDEGET
jgi:hypothetical protein